jgi:hypothetical protein
MAGTDDGYLMGIAVEMTVVVVGSLSCGLSDRFPIPNFSNRWRAGSLTGICCI